MNEVDQQQVVRHGLWFHGGVTACHVRILRHHTLQGTHDADDPPEIAHDRAVDCYYIRFDQPYATDIWVDGGVALSLREAVFMAERRLGPLVSWVD